MQAGRAEVREVIERAAHRRETTGGQTVLFLDEIHRFNKAQQDALLPAVEDGLVTLIGATTENPAFEVNGALLSRLRVYALRALSAEELESVLLACRGGSGRGRARGARVPRDAQRRRRAHRAQRSRAGSRHGHRAGRAARLGLERVEDALQRRAVLYDKGGRPPLRLHLGLDQGDPRLGPGRLALLPRGDARGRRGPEFIVRRMVILASEDIGNADPAALSLATAAAAAVEHVGLPEARYALAQAAIYLALAPKSDAAGRALSAARRTGARARRRTASGMASLGAQTRTGPRRI